MIVKFILLFSPFLLQKCDGDCPKDCSGGHITSLEELKGFKDCTQIFGDLFLEIKGGEFISKNDKLV